jgi:translation elongation factor EF-4
MSLPYGFFSSYEDGGYQKSDLGKMTFLLNGKPVDALALIIHRSAQDAVGREWVKKLRKFYGLSSCSFSNIQKFR